MGSVARDEIADRPDRGVSRERRETDDDGTRRFAVRKLCSAVATFPRETPREYQRGRYLDDTVESEPDQTDRPRNRTRTDCHDPFNRVLSAQKQVRR